MILRDSDIEVRSHMAPQDCDGMLWHVVVETEASTVERAVQAAAEMAAAYQYGRETWWRIRPEAHLEVNYTTEKVIMRGYTRFVFALHSGPEHEPTPLSYETRLSERGFGA